MTWQESQYPCECKERLVYSRVIHSLKEKFIPSCRCFLNVTICIVVRWTPVFSHQKVRKYWDLTLWNVPSSLLPGSYLQFVFVVVYSSFVLRSYFYNSDEFVYTDIFLSMNMICSFILLWILYYLIILLYVIIFFAIYDIYLCYTMSMLYFIIYSFYKPYIYTYLSWYITHIYL